MKQFVVITLLILAATALQATSSHDQFKPATPGAPGAQVQNTKQQRPGANFPSQLSQNQQGPGGNFPNLPQNANLPRPGSPQFYSQVPGAAPRAPISYLSQRPGSHPGSASPKPKIKFQYGSAHPGSATTSSTFTIPNPYKTGQGEPISINKPGYEATLGDPYGKNLQTVRTCLQAPCIRPPTASCKSHWVTAFYVVKTSNGQQAQYVAYRCLQNPKFVPTQKSKFVPKQK